MPGNVAALPPADLTIGEDCVVLNIHIPCTPESLPDLLRHLLEEVDIATARSAAGPEWAPARSDGCALCTQREDAWNNATTVAAAHAVREGLPEIAREILDLSGLLSIENFTLSEEEGGFADYDREVLLELFQEEHGDEDEDEDEDEDGPEQPEKDEQDEQPEKELVEGTSEASGPMAALAALESAEGIYWCTLAQLRDLVDPAIWDPATVRHPAAAIRHALNRLVEAGRWSKRAASDGSRALVYRPGKGRSR